MCFRIRHEKIGEVLVLIFLFLLLTVLSFVFIIKEMQLLLVCTLVLMLAVIILFILEQTVRTVIEIADHAVTVRRLFGKKRIAVSDISDVQITHYTRRRKRVHLEQRMRMTISLQNAKKLVLTDSAMMHTGGLQLSSSAILPDEDVPLWQAYQQIQALLRT